VKELEIRKKRITGFFEYVDKLLKISILQIKKSGLRFHIFYTFKVLYKENRF